MLENLMTEKQNSSTNKIDELSSIELAKLINKEDKKVALSVENEIESIANAIDLIADALSNGGRLFYIGAGTSGRLGVLDASECPPTFGTKPEKIVGIIAGGDHALRNAIEDAEDDKKQGASDISSYHINQNDILVGIAASGRTPYVVGAIEYAKSLEVKTVGLNCSEGSYLDKKTDIPITINVGPEVITGSTRMKSGTAQKLVLNMLSTGVMILNGKVYKNLMVDVQPTNEKLKHRQINIIQEATGVSENKAKDMLKKSNNKTKLAIFMLLTNLEISKAINLLDEYNGHIKKALQAFERRKI